MVVEWASGPLLVIVIIFLPSLVYKSYWCVQIVFLAGIISLLLSIIDIFSEQCSIEFLEKCWALYAKVYPAPISQQPRGADLEHLCEHP